MSQPIPTDSIFQITANADDPTTVDLRIDGEIGYRSYWWEEEDEQKRVLTSKELRSELNKIKELEASHIRVFINSLGGLVNHALNMYDALVSHPAKVTTVIEGGYSASAATVIFMAGDVRKISENALFLVHKSLITPWDWSFNENALEDLLEDVRATDKRIRAIYSRAGIDAEDLDLLMNAQHGSGKWIDADEVISYGFATEVVEAKGLLTASTSQKRLQQLTNTVLPPIPNNHKTHFKNSKTHSKNYSKTFKNHPLRDKKQDIMNDKPQKSWWNNLFGNKTEQEVDSSLTALTARIDNLEAKTKTLEATNQEQKTQIDNLTAQNKQFEEQIKNLQTEKTTLEEQVANKDKSIEDLTAKVSDLEAKKTDLEAKNSDLEATIAKNSGTKTKMEGNDPSVSTEPKTQNEEAYENNYDYFLN